MLFLESHPLPFYKVSSFMVRSFLFVGGGVLVMIEIVVKFTPNPILIIKAPNIEPYHRSLIEPFKDPFKGTLL